MKTTQDIAIMHRMDHHRCKRLHIINNRIIQIWNSRVWSTVTHRKSATQNRSQIGISDTSRINNQEIQRPRRSASSTRMALHFQRMATQCYGQRSSNLKCQFGCRWTHHTDWSNNWLRDSVKAGTRLCKQRRERKGSRTYRSPIRYLLRMEPNCRR